MLENGERIEMGKLEDESVTLRIKTQHCKLNSPFIQVDVDQIFLVREIVVVSVVFWLWGFRGCAS